MCFVYMYTTSCASDSALFKKVSNVIELTIKRRTRMGYTCGRSRKLQSFHKEPEILVESSFQLSR